MHGCTSKCTDAVGRKDTHGVEEKPVRFRKPFGNCPKSALNLELADENAPIVADSAGSEKYLGHLVALAMYDGMMGVGLGVDRATKQAWMQFFGPCWSDTPVWFDLVAPGAFFYPVAFQVCFKLAELNSDIPIRGTILGRKGRKRVALEFEAEELDSFQLSWPAESCERCRETVLGAHPGPGDPPRGVAAIRAGRVEAS